ncbi:chain-length determining protein [Rhizobium sp. CRIBSB]|nr:chain-length determining protein [Rhizobium sp. CRIBSB]
MPWPFLLVVGLPTLLAAIYFLLIASPRYVSEARFLVRQPNQAQPSSLGVALQGAGIAPAQTDAFAVHEYIRSREALAELDQRRDIGAMLGMGDVFARYPRPWESRTLEGRRKAFQRFVTVGYDSTTGISTLRVEAFRPEDAQALAEGLLQGGEGLVNRLNTRAAADAVAEAMTAKVEAQAALTAAQMRLTAFRNRERFIDPQRAAAESAQLIGQLSATVAGLRAERAQLAAEAPQSPQLPGLDNRIAAYERQIAAERAKVAGEAGSLAPRVSVYEDLVLTRELADRQASEADAALIQARQDARRQRLYLERVVNPGRPDEALEPRRWSSILTVLITMLLIYGIGWLVLAGVREHRQDA